MGKLSGRLSGRGLFFISFGLYALALILIPLIHRPWLLVAPVALFGILMIS